MYKYLTYATIVAISFQTFGMEQKTSPRSRSQSLSGSLSRKFGRTRSFTESLENFSQEKIKAFTKTQDSIKNKSPEQSKSVIRDAVYKLQQLITDKALNKESLDNLYFKTLVQYKDTELESSQQRSPELSNDVKRRSGEIKKGLVALQLRLEFSRYITSYIQSVLKPNHQQDRAQQYEELIMYLADINKLDNSTNNEILRKSFSNLQLTGVIEQTKDDKEE